MRPNIRFPSGRPTPSRFLVVSITLVLIVSNLVATATAAGSQDRSIGTASRSQPVVAGSELERAVQSLGSGAGPHPGTGMECRPVASGSAECAAVLATHRASSAAGASDWWNLSSRIAVAPSARYFASIADDPADHYVLLFGGFTGTVAYADTWTYSGGKWTQLFPSVSPVGRALGSMTYDAADGYVLLFGGANLSASLGDTWKFSAGSWTQLSPSTSPNPRGDASMVYDAADREVVLFGGTNSTKTFTDTWAFSGGARTQLSPGTSPAARTFAAIGYDAADGYVVLFGGYNATSVPLADTWRFSGGTWTELTSANHPSARVGAETAWDGPDGQLLLYGGTNGTVQPLDTWAFHNGGWFPLAPAANPGSLLVQAMSWDSTDGYVLLFSGATSNVHAPAPQPSTWVYVAPLTVRPSSSSAKTDVGMAVTFTANATGGIAPRFYNWSFGSGASASTSVNPQVSFGHPGTIEAIENASDTLGERASGSVNVTVNPALAAAFTVSPSNGTNGQALSFSATWTGGTGPYTVVWTFGDGSTAAGANATHTYAKAGTYAVSVNVTDSVGARARSSSSLAVSSPSSGGLLSGSGAILLYLLVGVVVVVAAIAVGLMMLRRRRSGVPPPGATAPPPPAAAPPPGGPASPGGGPPPPG